MNDASKPNADEPYEVSTFDLMLELADHELRGLCDYFATCSEISQSTTGGEFIDALGIASLALTRLRLEREAEPFTDADHTALHNAIAILKRDSP